MGTRSPDVKGGEGGCEVDERLRRLERQGGELIRGGESPYTSAATARLERLLERLRGSVEPEA